MSRRKRSPKQKREFLDTDVDIVIPVHGRFDLLKSCVESIPQAAGDYSYRVYIFDNASPDKNEADEYYRSIYSGKGISIIRNNQNVGFPKACNQAAKRGRSPYIFFLNSDVVLYPDAISFALDEMKDEKIGVVGMKLIFPPEQTTDPNRYPPGKIQHVGLSTNIRGDFVHTFIGWSPDNEKVNAVREVYAVTGAALLTRRNLWIKIGGFDEVYGFGTWEDVDYCLSVRELGYNVITSIKSVAWHYTNATANEYKIPYPVENNRYIFLQKWQQRLNYTEWNLL